MHELHCTSNIYVANLIEIDVTGKDVIVILVVKKPFYPSNIQAST